MKDRISTCAMVLALAVALSGEAMAQTADEWWVMLTEIERDIAQADTEHRNIPNLGASDRRFVRQMANVLSLHEDAVPTPSQAQWLKAIRQWIDAAKR